LKHIFTRDLLFPKRFYKTQKSFEKNYVVQIDFYESHTDPMIHRSLSNCYFSALINLFLLAHMCEGDLKSRHFRREIRSRKLQSELCCRKTASLASIITENPPANNFCYFYTHSTFFLRAPV
jgi:hypothetical protein